VTAYTRNGVSEQIGDSGPIEVEEGTSHVPVLLTLDEGQMHVMKVLDTSTNGGVPGAEIFVIRSDGLPIAPWSQGWSLHCEKYQVRLFEHLAPGDYTVFARVRAARPGESDYRMVDGPVKVHKTLDGPIVTQIFLRKVELGELETERRWPFVVHGSVRDEAGEPLGNVEISVHCGLGTLLQRGATRTDPKGGYSLRFDAAWHSIDEATGQSIAPPQAATVAPSLSGWYERDLHRGGDLMIASELPIGGDPARFLLPGRAHRLDFVMRRGARITGLLLDDLGEPLAGETLALGGAELWPSSSVLHSTTTDENGQFTFEPVPLGIVVWFEHGGRRSDGFGISEPTTVRVLARLTEDGEIEAARVLDDPLPKPGSRGG